MNGHPIRNMPFLAPEADLLPSGRTAFGDPILGGSPVSPARATSISNAVIAGFQSSATGLALRGKLPEQQFGEDAPWYQRLAAGAAGVAADLPLSVVGAVAGSAAGSAVAPGPGTVIGGGAGAFAAPMALREALIEAYSNNHALSWEGVWEITKAALKGGAKGAVIGGATAGAGRVVAPLVTRAGGGAAAAGTAAFGAELATLTTTAAALEGHLPTWQDFMDGAILLGGMKGAMHIAKGLRNIYAETGKKPAEVVADAKVDPELKAALLRGEIPSQYGPLAIEQRIKAALDFDPRPEIIKQFLQEVEKPIDLTKPPLNNPVRGEYIVDDATHKGVLRLITEKYKPEIEAQRRGIVSNTQTLNEARDMLTGNKLGPHEVGAAANAPESVARNILLRGATMDVAKAAAELRELAPNVKDITAELKLYASIERLAIFKAEADGVRAEWGRAGQIMGQLKRDPTVLSDAETYLKIASRKGTMQEIAQRLAILKDPAQVTRFAEDTIKATGLEMALEGWKAAILSGPLTSGANVFGNLTKWVVEIPESTIAASLFAMNKAVKGEPLTMAQWKARAFAPIYGLQHGSREAVTVAAEVWKGTGQHLEKADVYRVAIPGKAGEYIRLPFKLLQVQDVLFRTPAERGRAYVLAVDRAVAEGLHPGTKEWNQTVVAYTARPEFGLTEKAGQAVIADIQQVGAEAVFSQRLGPRMETVQRAMAGSGLGFVLPFVRTPTNLVSWALQHVPGLNLLSGRWRADFAAGGESRARATARVVIGTGLTITAYSLAQDGLLTGGGLFDKELRKTKMAAGWQPYSIKVGDTYYSYQRIEPVAKVLGIAADLVEMLESKKFDDADTLKIAGMLVLLFGNATVSTTYLSGLSNVINGVTDPDRYAETILEQYASSLVPKIIGQPVAMMDEYKREVDGVVDAIQSQLPYFREKLLPKRDVWGEPVANERWFAVMPVTTTEESKDKVRNEAVRLGVAVADAPKYVMERAPFAPKDKRVELTGEQRDIFREVSGKNATAILAPIVNAPDWERIPDFAKAEIYKRVLESARKQAQYKALPPEGPEREALRRKIVDRIVKETQEAEQK